MQRDLVPIQSGFLEEGSQEICDLIHTFCSSADFAEWITEGKFEQTIVYEKLESEKYARAYLYSIHKSVFFHGKLEVGTPKLEKGAVQFLTQRRAPLYSNELALREMRKHNISRIIALPYYTVISQCLWKEIEMGMCWEIYNIPLLETLYNQKEDPLRYWKNRRQQ